MLPHACRTAEPPQLALADEARRPPGARPDALTRRGSWPNRVIGRLNNPDAALKC